MKFPNFLVLASLYAASMGLLTSVCMTNVVELMAGESMITASLYNPVGGQCMASLEFDDPEFLPITYSFEPSGCVGSEVASFLLPLGVPNGGAFIIWRCAGIMPMCSRAFITGGLASGGFGLYSEGLLACDTTSKKEETTFITSITPPASSDARSDAVTKGLETQTPSPSPTPSSTITTPTEESPGSAVTPALLLTTLLTTITVSQTVTACESC